MDRALTADERHFVVAVFSGHLSLYESGQTHRVEEGQPPKVDDDPPGTPVLQLMHHVFKLGSGTHVQLAVQPEGRGARVAGVHLVAEGLRITDQAATPMSFAERDRVETSLRGTYSRTVGRMEPPILGREMVLPVDRSAAQQARAAIDEAIPHPALEGRWEDPLLAVTELVSSAVRHAGLEPRAALIRLVIQEDFADEWAMSLGHRAGSGASSDVEVRPRNTHHGAPGRLRLRFPSPPGWPDSGRVYRWPTRSRSVRVRSVSNALAAWS